MNGDRQSGKDDGEVMVGPAVTVRGAHAGDRAFVLEAVRRLSSFGVPAGRTADEIVEGEARTLREFFDRGDAPGTLLVAEAGGQACGFIFLEDKQDYFTLEMHGHIGILVVGAAAEGSGVGGVLMRAADAWARSLGYRKLTLNVFDGNRRARGLYEHLGFEPDTVKYLKTLEGS